MRIVFLTHAEFDSDGKFLYMFAHVAACFRDVHVMAVHPGSDNEKPSVLLKLQRKLWKIWNKPSVLLKKLQKIWNRGQRFGFLDTLEILSSQPLHTLLVRMNDEQMYERLRALPQPPIMPHPDRVVRVSTFNGPDAEAAIRGLKPDVLVVFGGIGILRKHIFEIAS